MCVAVGLHGGANPGWEFPASGNGGEDGGLVVQRLDPHHQMQKVMFLIMIAVDCVVSMSRPAHPSVTCTRAVLLSP